VRASLPFGSRIPVLLDNQVIGGGYRDNALCPVCGSLDRERLLYLFLRSKTDVFDTPTRLLHVAPEPRLGEMLLAQANVHYLSADLHAGNVMLIMDITDICFPDSSFDAIICNHVLEHVTDDRRAISELARTLKPRAGFEVSVFRWTAAPDNFGGRRNVFGLRRSQSTSSGSGRSESRFSPAHRGEA
jgi:SAM-dependent methyltransferase